ncbi:hypothetical protein DFH06DRAFT_1337123 [Mycena polygramma]|nr:hypothetical protein DFH06DRAFT_1337123 [Mycena polygramma]
MDPSLMHELLRSHCELSSDQLSSLISALSEQLASCDEERATLYSKIIKVDAQRAALRKKLRQCRTFQAPIRRLPSEILVEIFKSTVAGTGPQQDLVDEYATDRALHRLAQAPLLTVSQVCARSHSIALSTPALWSNIHLHEALWRSDASAEKCMDLLQSALDRGTSHPLTIVVSAPLMTSTRHVRPLIRLAAHSARWRSVTFEGSFWYLSIFSNIRGNLPILETLTIAPTQDDADRIMDCFQLAPRLSDLSISGLFLARLPTPPLAQIQKIQLVNLASEDIAPAVSTMSRLSSANRFTLQFYLDDFTSSRSHILELGIQPTSSDVGHLTIELEGEFFKHHCQQALSAIFAALTLPRLERLNFKSEEYPRFPLVWPQPQFIALGQRSAFHTTLRSLCLFHVHITEAQLLQCLTALPALTSLAIADHERISGRGVNLELITDALLGALTKTSDTPCLVSELDAFSVRSRLQFTDSVYLNFVLSRIRPERRFTAALDILPHWTAGRAIDAAVLTRLRELVARGDLTISLPDYVCV